MQISHFRADIHINSLFNNKKIGSLDMCLVSHLLLRHINFCEPSQLGL